MKSLRKERVIDIINRVNGIPDIDFDSIHWEFENDYLARLTLVVEKVVMNSCLMVSACELGQGIYREYPFYDRVFVRST